MMRALLPLFMQKLADDYQRWAGDAAYRARRAAVQPTPAAAAPPAAAAAVRPPA
jgi:hypothetical protein